LRAAAVLLLMMSVAACGGANDTLPTSPATAGPSPTSSTKLTAAQQRCLDEASFLTRAATAMEDLVQQAGMSTVDRSVLAEVVSAATAQQTSVQARTIHTPFTSPKATILRGIQDILTGYQAIQAGEGTVGPGQASRGLVTSGLNEIIAAQTDIEVKRASCR
jgi:hypothetical protein